MSITAIIVAAGSGTRLGDKLPKAFIDLGGKPLFFHSLQTFCDHKKVTEVVLVVHESMVRKAEDLVAQSNIDRHVHCVAGGEERWQSVKNGATAAKGEWLLVHDAARPFVTSKVIDAVIEKSADFECAITSMPEIDTIRKYTGDIAGEVVDRSTLVRIGTPQLFKRTLLMKSFDTVSSLPALPTDEAMLIQAMGVAVGLAPGDPLNFKITTPADRELAEALIAKRSK